MMGMKAFLAGNTFWCKETGLSCLEYLNEG